MPTHKVFIGTGSNTGDRFCNIREAVDLLALIHETTVCKVSSMYMTEPIGDMEQNRFYNGAILLETSLSPEEIRRQCKSIEQKLGRPDTYARWSPRVIDLDILLYDTVCLTTKDLSIPHPELHRRKFVLIPLLDLDNPVHPGMRKTVRELLECCEDRSVLVKLLEPPGRQKGQTIL